MNDFSQPFADELKPSFVVDAIVPAFNAAPYIRETLESIAAQTVGLGKVIVVNDGSTDETLDVVEAFKRAWPLLEVVIVMQPNSGLPAARNAGIKASSAPFVALLDADDVWEPSKLEKQLDCFRNSRWPALGVVYCNYSLIDENSSPLPRTGPQLDTGLRGRIGHRLRHANLVAGSASAVLIRKACFERVGLFDETLPAAEDWDMWSRIAEHYDYDYVPEALVQIRRHRHGMQTNTLRMLDAHLRLLQKRFVMKRGSWRHVMTVRHLWVTSRASPDQLPVWHELDGAVHKLFKGPTFVLWSLFFKSVDEIRRFRRVYLQALRRA